MLDITLNFKGLFAGCFKCFRNNKQDVIINELDLSYISNLRIDNMTKIEILCKVLKILGPNGFIYVNKFENDKLINIFIDGIKLTEIGAFKPSWNIPLFNNRIQVGSCGVGIESNEPIPNFLKNIIDMIADLI